MAEAATVLHLLTGLPTELTGFVGRRQDRADVRRLLSTSRLVTLTGFGGIGKTRLAVRVAHELSRLYADGTCFVPFGEVADPALVADAVASALGIQDRSTRLDASRLADHLRHRELLLVLDNCEHLIDACAALVGALLPNCPRLRIIATSREPLRVQGEAVRPVLPLSFPSRMEGALAGAEAYESVQLLVERANEVAPGFVLTEGNRAPIIEICRLLDGMPLALELAAVRLTALSPADLLQELRRHWQMLDIGVRAGADRRQTMTSCLEWSHTLCSPEERDLWARLSVFVGGLEMDAIRRVAAAELPDALPRDRIVDLVHALVDKSILTCEPGHDGMRYRMLEIIRLFGIARLDESGRLMSMRATHRDWCAELLETVADRWMSAEQVEGMRRVRREDANLRTALRFCWREPGEAAVGLDMAAKLRKYSMAYGWFSEDRLWLHRLLPLVPEPSAVRFDGVHAACWLAVLQGDRETAADLLAECTELAQTLDEAAAARAAQLSGWHDLFLGDLSAAVVHLKRAVEGFTALGWQEERADTLVLLGMGLGFSGDLEAAATAHETCLQICSGGSGQWARSYALQWGGLIACEQGDQEKALAWERESLELKRAIQERLGVALCLEALAWIECETDPHRSAIMLGSSAALWRTIGSAPEALPGLLKYHTTSEAKVREALTEEQFLEAFEQGAMLSVDTAVAFALSETSAAAPRATSATDEAWTSVGLTKREREIALLIADGLSNKEIAKNLVISTRTAESHVEHVLIKLGFTSRAQIAAWITHSAAAGNR